MQPTVFVHSGLRHQQASPGITTSGIGLSNEESTEAEKPRNSSTAMVLGSRPTATSYTSIRTVDLSAFEEVISVSHLMHKLSLGNSAEPLSTAAPPWLLAALEAPPASGDTAHLAAQALAAAYFGRVHHQESMVQKGAVIYGRALKGLAADLEDPTKASHYLALTTIMCLGTYELVAFTSGQGWTQHAGAVAKLVGRLYGMFGYTY